MATGPGPRQNFPSRIIRINFAAGGYIVLNIVAGSSAKTGTPPTPSVSYDVGSTKDGKKVAKFLDKKENSEITEGTGLSRFIVWNDIIPFPTWDDFNLEVFPRIGFNASYMVSYATQFAQVNSNATTNFRLVEVPQWSVYGWTGAYDQYGNRIEGTGELFYDPPFRQRPSIFVPEGAKTPLYDEKIPGIDNPRFASYGVFSGLFENMDFARTYCADYKTYWTQWGNHFTYPVNWQRAFTRESTPAELKWAEVNSFPLDLYPAELKEPGGKTNTYKGYFLFQIPGGLQDQLSVRISGDYGSITVLGYSDVKHDFKGKQPKLSDFNYEIGNHGEIGPVVGDPKLIQPDDQAPGDQSDWPFDVEESASISKGGSTLIVRTKIVPTKEKTKPHFTLINIQGGSNGGSTVG
jgi:hypothetical protein